MATTPSPHPAYEEAVFQRIIYLKQQQEKDTSPKQMVSKFQTYRIGCQQKMPLRELRFSPATSFPPDPDSWPVNGAAMARIWDFSVSFEPKMVANAMARFW